MAKNTSILLGDYFEDFISKQIKTGKFSSASEVIRSALRLFEYEESKKEELISALQKGERSGFITDFNRSDFLNKIHEKNTSK
ncbi:MAG TPA: type II toxin-antitoxin system ParD family antitoxin [Aequorivita sp.]|nr:type II toxin-antitoxin system ParD family antitoxin [Aequorivita sp.]